MPYTSAYNKNNDTTLDRLKIFELSLFLFPSKRGFILTSGGLSRLIGQGTHNRGVFSASNQGGAAVVVSGGTILPGKVGEALGKGSCSAFAGDQDMPGVRPIDPGDAGGS